MTRFRSSSLGNKIAADGVFEFGLSDWKENHGLADHRNDCQDDGSTGCCGETVGCGRWLIDCSNNEALT